VLEGETDMGGHWPFPDLQGGWALMMIGTVFFLWCRPSLTSVCFSGGGEALVDAKWNRLNRSRGGAGVDTPCSLALNLNGVATLDERKAQRASGGSE